MDTLKDLVPIVISIIAAIVSIFGLARQWRRDKSDIAETYEQMATRQAVTIKQLKEDFEALNCEVQELRKIVAEWGIGIPQLISALEDNGIPVPWKPEPKTQPRPR